MSRNQEVYNPALAHCSSLHLKFNGKQLFLLGGFQDRHYAAVSGSGRESNAASQKKFGGPIPEGTWWVRPDEMWHRDWLRGLLLGDAHRRSWGDYRLTIHPFPTTTTHGRKGFFIHGGAELGSLGCIDLAKEMPRFVTDLKRELSGRVCQIHLAVRYE